MRRQRSSGVRPPTCKYFAPGYAASSLRSPRRGELRLGKPVYWLDNANPKGKTAPAKRSEAGRLRSSVSGELRLGKSVYWLDNANPKGKTATAESEHHTSCP